LYVRFAKLGTQVSEFLRAGSFLAAERLDLNNAGCNPVYHTGLSSPTTEWLNIHESNNTSINNSTTLVLFYDKINSPTLQGGDYQKDIILLF